MSIQKYPIGLRDFSEVITRGYVEQYKNREETVHLIGINFSSKKKEVEEVIWEEGF